ncbi:MAG: glutamate synthase-related protein [Chloroflexota bacterium]|nr:glutamate synthase-related protein [Chloroflexota bacterium]
MPKKYHVNIQSLPPRFEPIPEYCSIEVNKCLHCRNCVKYSACVYNVYRGRTFDAQEVLDTGDSECAGCMRCVQECKANILSRTRNLRFEALGDDYWRPALIGQIWNQAETGKIPVSGAGYRGMFHGPGFDQMWTDMSEIVRPTRDGIHGREYISTLIDVGRRPERLEFGPDGHLLNEPPASLEIPIPIILDIPPLDVESRPVREAIVRAATNLDTLAVARYEESQGYLGGYSKNLVVKFDHTRDSASAIDGAPIVEIAYADDVMNTVGTIKEHKPTIVTSIRLPLDEHAAERASRLTRSGAEVIHLQASPQGRGLGTRENDFITNLVREVHLRLVEESIRDRVTLFVSGGIAMAEHVAKIIICGVDGVGIDIALMAALECRLCSECGNGTECPVHLDTMPVEYGAQRIVNLIGSWHSQLIEVMGAMGIREVRRLRGETGRAMLFDDLEDDNFAPIFGKRIGAASPSENPGTGVVAAGDKPPLLPAPVSWTFPQTEGLLNICHSRYRNKLPKYRVVRTNVCIACGKCAEVCAYGVHVKAGSLMAHPRSHLCVGVGVCQKNSSFCADTCPQQAIRVSLDPVWETFGDPRWTPDLIVSTWLQAETGRPPDNGLEYRVGASGGGFDRIDFAFPGTLPNPDIKPRDIDLSIPLNRRTDDNRPPVEIGFPVYGGGMSFGAISLATIVSRAKAYRVFGSFTCTGEGGYPDALAPYADNVITQVATGLFGVREETIQRTPIVEFKYAQGAKPGLGGHLLGDKVTAAVAKIRESVEGNALFSPFPFHSVYSVEDHKKHVDWIKSINPRALVSVKVSTPTDVDMVAVGSYYAGAHIIHIDGSYGGTGAAPDIAKKNIAMPIEYAIPKVHQFLVDEGIRDQMTLIASGGIRSAWDVAKAIALGADGVVIATSEMVALECIRCGRCESGRGCPRGIATTDTELSTSFSSEWATQRLINLFHSYAIQLQEILWRFGMKSIQELVGRADLLRHQDYIDKTSPTPGELATSHK